MAGRKGSQGLGEGAETAGVGSRGVRVGVAVTRHFKMAVAPPVHTVSWLLMGTPSVIQCIDKSTRPAAGPPALNLSLLPSSLFTLTPL